MNKDKWIGDALDEMLGEIPEEEFKKLPTNMAMGGVQFNFDFVFNALEKAMSEPQASADPLDDMVHKTNIFIKEYLRLEYESYSGFCGGGCDETP